LEKKRTIDAFSNSKFSAFWMQSMNANEGKLPKLMAQDRPLFIAGFEHLIFKMEIKLNIFSAGIGRTGTYLALDILINRIKQKGLL
jgi:protein tyrosine phosphatase